MGLGCSYDNIVIIFNWICPTYTIFYSCYACVCVCVCDCSFILNWNCAVAPVLFTRPTKAPWYVSKFTIHNDLQIPFVIEEIHTYFLSGSRCGMEMTCVQHISTIKCYHKVVLICTYLFEKPKKQSARESSGGEGSKRRSKFIPRIKDMFH
jgi:hypothetical protein